MNETRIRAVLLKCEGDKADHRLRSARPVSEGRREYECVCVWWGKGFKEERSDLY